MRNPKAGDMLVISEYYDENEERIIDSEKDRPRMAVVEKVTDGTVWADDILSDYTYQILVGSPDSLDRWRMAVREGDRLVVTKINGKDTEPTEVTADEDEWEVAGGVIFIDRTVIPDDYLSDILDVQQSESGDVWEFAENTFGSIDYSDESEKEVAKEVCGDICDSYNDVVAKDDVESEYTPQSFSDFNASSGGGKTLKDYTGVGFTKEELAFKSSHEMAIESLTADSLAFSPIESDNVNHPSHYNYGDIEVIDMLEALSSGYSNSTDAYLISTAAKYLYRADHKGKKVEDWKKAVWYIERAIEREEAYNE